MQLCSQEIAVHSLPTTPNPGQGWWLPWPLPCRQNHHHVNSSYGWGRPPWGSHCHHCPGKAVLLRHPAFPEELLWHGFVLNLGAQDEKHPEPKERQWGRCLPREGPWPGEKERTARGCHSRQGYSHRLSSSESVSLFWDHLQKISMNIFWSLLLQRCFSQNETTSFKWSAIITCQITHQDPKLQMWFGAT